MRRIITLSFILLAVCIGSMAQTKEMLGLKGEILAHEVKFYGTDEVTEDLAQLSFKEEKGMLKSFKLMEIQFINISKHANSISGNFNIPGIKRKGKFIGDLDKNDMISSISLGQDGVNLTAKFEYNKHGQMQSMHISFGDDYDSGGVIYEFYDYHYDKIGNWTYRKVKTTNDDEVNGLVVKEEAYYQTQTITYPKNYVERQKWDEAVKDGSMEAYAQYAQSIGNEEYKHRATTQWNYMAMQKLQSDGNKTMDNLLNLLRNPVANEQVKAECERQYTTLYIIPVNDYAKLRQLLDDDMLNDNLRKVIMNKADEAYADSVKHLTYSMENAFNTNQYDECIAYARMLDDINPGSSRPTEFINECNYKKIAEKEKSGRISDEDYETFLKENSGSPYFAEIADRRAQMAFAKAKSTGSIDDFQRLRELPMSDALKQQILPEAERQVGKVAKKNEREQKWQAFKNNSGSFFHMQFGGGMDFGSYSAVVYGEADMRFGWHISFVNLMVGAKYNSITSWDNPWGFDKNTPEYLITQKLSIPIVLRLNVKRKYESATFIGIGAEYNTPIMKAKVDKVKYPVEDFLNTDSKLSPRLSVGFSGKYAEFEVYVLYNLKPEFNNLESLGLRNFNSKMWSDNSADKLRGGLKLTVGF